MTLQNAEVRLEEGIDFTQPSVSFNSNNLEQFAQALDNVVIIGSSEFQEDNSNYDDTSRVKKSAFLDIQNEIDELNLESKERYTGSVLREGTVNTVNTLLVLEMGDGQQLGNT